MQYAPHIALVACNGDRATAILYFAASTNRSSAHLADTSFQAALTGIIKILLPKYE